MQHAAASLLHAIAAEQWSLWEESAKNEASLKCSERLTTYFVLHTEYCVRCTAHPTKCFPFPANAAHYRQRPRRIKQGNTGNLIVEPRPKNPPETSKLRNLEILRPRDLETNAANQALPMQYAQKLCSYFVPSGHFPDPAAQNLFLHSYLPLDLARGFMDGHGCQRVPGLVFLQTSSQGRHFNELGKRGPFPDGALSSTSVSFSSRCPFPTSLPIRRRSSVACFRCLILECVSVQRRRKHLASFSVPPSQSAVPVSLCFPPFLTVSTNLAKSAANFSILCDPYDVLRTCNPYPHCMRHFVSPVNAQLPTSTS